MERVPGIRPRQGAGRKTQGQLSSTVWVQPCWLSTGTNRACEVGLQLSGLEKPAVPVLAGASRPVTRCGVCFLPLRMQSREGIKGTLVETMGVYGAGSPRSGHGAVTGVDTARVSFIRAEGPRGLEELRHPLPLPTPHFQNVRQPQL